MSSDVARMTAGEILFAFEKRLEASGSAPAEHAVALELAAPAIAIWCFLRDDEQVADTADCLAEFTRFAGPANLRHHLRRHDVPQELIERARRAFVSPSGESSPEATWDDDLHPRLFAPFARTIQAPTR